MNKGYFDNSNPDWIVHISDKRGRPLDLGKDKIHKARDKSNPKKMNGFKIIRGVWGQQTDLPEKVNVIAEILWDDGDTSCWLFYYIFDRYGKWAFGQFGPMMPIADFRELYEYAHEKGIL
jgi:hypothetical protein